MASKPDWGPTLVWGNNIARPPSFSSDEAPWSGALIRSWEGGSAELDLPALDQHLVVRHSGGPKRLTCRRDGRSRTVDAELGAISLMPAGGGQSWSTQGPIAFTHVYLDPERVDRAVVEAFDRSPSRVRLTDLLGRSEPLLSSLIEELRRELAAGEVAPALFLDSLFDAFVLGLLRRCSNLAEVTSRPPCSMAPRRLKRVLDCVEARLAEPITLDDLAETAGMSRFHFSRVFREETGVPPYAYLLGRRVDLAKSLLRDTQASLPEVMERTGFSSPTRFAANFRRATGRSPAQYRREA